MEARGGVHTSAIVVPVVLVLLIVASIAIWQLRREFFSFLIAFYNNQTHLLHFFDPYCLFTGIKQRNGSLNM